MSLMAKKINRNVSESYMEASFFVVSVCYFERQLKEFFFT